MIPLGGVVPHTIKATCPPFRVPRSTIERQAFKLLPVSTQVSVAMVVAWETIVTGPQPGTCFGSQAGAFHFDFCSYANQCSVSIDIRLRIGYLTAIATRRPTVQKEAREHDVNLWQGTSVDLLREWRGFLVDGCSAASDPSEATPFGAKRSGLRNSDGTIPDGKVL